jgi:hypothetical protein
LSFHHKRSAKTCQESTASAWIKRLEERKSNPIFRIGSVEEMNDALPSALLVDKSIAVAHSIFNRLNSRRAWIHLSTKKLVWLRSS